MNLLQLIKSEFDGFGKIERIIFPMVLLLTIIISFYANDNKVALVSAICGMSYTILAGKGKISCYYIGIVGTICYSYIAYKNGFYGNVLLYGIYYLSMDVIGIIQWRKHMKEDKREVIKSKLSLKEKLIYFSLASIITVILFFILKKVGASNPYLDSFTTVFSVLGLFLTVKRCMEQWYIWFFVNMFSLIMWIGAYINGSNCLATVIMWIVYVILAIYFLITWRKEVYNVAN